jgi:LPS O-antigen subunit length determinant protein (WzzB/FepE family)
VAIEKHEYDLSLLKIWKVIVQYRMVIIAVMFVFTSIVYYIFLSTSQTTRYTSTIKLTLPLAHDIKGLIDHSMGASKIGNMLENVKFKITPEHVFHYFSNSVKSREAWEEFFINRYYQPSNIKKTLLTQKSNINQVNAASIYKSIGIKNISDNHGNSIVITFNSNSPEVAYEILNDFVDFVDQKAVKDILSDVNTVRRLRVDYLTKFLALNPSETASRMVSMEIEMLNDLAYSDSIHAVTKSNFYPEKMKTTSKELVIFLSIIFSAMFGILISLLMNLIKLRKSIN